MEDSDIALVIPTQATHVGRDAPRRVELTMELHLDGLSDVRCVLCVATATTMMVTTTSTTSASTTSASPPMDEIKSEDAKDDHI